MRSFPSKIALILLLVVIAVVLAITVPRLLRSTPEAPTPKNYHPMVRSADADLVELLNKADLVEQINLLSAQRESEGKIRVAGIGDTRERISEYLGALERIGLKDYVIDITESPAPNIRGFRFVISGKLTE